MNLLSAPLIAAGVGVVSVSTALLGQVQLSSTYLPSIVAGIGIVGAALAAIVAYRKARPEATAIIVDAAKDIVILQKGELSRLQQSLETAHSRIEELEKENGLLKKRLREEDKRIEELERRLNEIDPIKRN